MSEITTLALTDTYTGNKKYSIHVSKVSHNEPYIHADDFFEIHALEYNGVVAIDCTHICMVDTFDEAHKAYTKALKKYNKMDVV